jgi:hypothetical protein
LPPPLTFGNAPVYLPIRQPNFKTESFGVFKDTDQGGQRYSSAWRCRTVQPRSVRRAGERLSAGNFGRITSVANSPRNIQFGLKMLF